MPRKAPLHPFLLLLATHCIEIQAWLTGHAASRLNLTRDPKDVSGLVLMQINARAVDLSLPMLPERNLTEKDTTPRGRGASHGSPQDPLNIVVISDREEALIGSIGSLMLHTTHPTIAHIITRKENLQEALNMVFGNASSVVQVKTILFDTVMDDLRSRGMSPVWTWPEFGLSIKDPIAWTRNGTVRTDKWDNLPVHSNPMNLLRFYLPEMTHFKRMSTLIFMDDDIIVKGDLAKLINIHPTQGRVQLATCSLWKWGGGKKDQCESFSLHTRMPLDETDFMYLNGHVQQSPGYRMTLETTIRNVNGREPELHSVDYWNYGFVKLNLTEWRHAKLTRAFGAWMKANYAKHIFPERSLSYGLGIAQVMLMGRVQCWDEVNISISDGLGYVAAEDFHRAQLSLASLNTSFVLHWSGNEKPFVESPPQPFRHHWNDVLRSLGVPEVKDLKVEPRRKALLVTDTPPGSEWLLDLIDQHPRVCASKGEVYSFPRESLITGDFDTLGIEYCSRAVSCTWSFVSQWVPIFYRYHNVFCSNKNAGLWRAQFPHAEKVYSLNRDRMCSWADEFYVQNKELTPQSLFDMYVGVAFGSRSRSMLGCACPPSKDVQILKFVSDWWVGDQQRVDHFDYRLFNAPREEFKNLSRSQVRRDFRFREGFLNRLNSPQLSINFSEFSIVSFSRENIFEQYVSSLVASEAVKHPESIGKPVFVDVDRMLHYIDDALRSRSSFSKTLQQQTSNVLFLTYEECVNDPLSCVERIQTYLQVEWKPVEISSMVASLKTTDMFAHIKNGQAVRKALMDYGFSKWIRTSVPSLWASVGHLNFSMRTEFIVPMVALLHKNALGPEPSYWWDGSSDRLIFLHIHRTGGTTFAHLLGGKDFSTVNVSGKLIQRHFLRNSIPCLPDATCKIQNFAADVLDGPEKEMCWNKWPGPTAHYIHRLQELEESNCRFVELHHFDITGAMPFVRNGYKVVTIIREPVSHLESRFLYELLRRWNYEGELDDESYNLTFARFAKWSESQSSPQQGLRYLTGCSSSRIHDPQLNFIYSQIEDISPGLCSYEYLNGPPKFPINPSIASTMVPLALEVARNRIATVLVFEAWDASLALVSRKHGYANVTEDNSYFNAVGNKQFSFKMLPLEQQRRLHSRLLPDTQLYNLLSVRFAADAQDFNVNINNLYAECSCTEFRFPNRTSLVHCENKVSPVGPSSQICMPPRSDGTCELDQVKCIKMGPQRPYMGGQQVQQEELSIISQWEHLALAKLADVVRAIGYMVMGQSLTRADSASPARLMYSYEERRETYCGGTTTDKIIGPTTWTLDDALSACDAVEDCLCVSMHQREDSNANVFELSVFGSTADAATVKLDTLLWSPSAAQRCGNSQEWVAGDVRCFLRENKDWHSYKKNL